MKKILTLMLALVMVLSVVSLVACQTTETYTGSYSYYVEAWYTTYGTKVDVEVTGGKISNLKVYTDEETGWVQLSDGWEDKDTWTEGSNDFLLTFIGMTAEEVGEIEATIAVIDGEDYISDDTHIVTGATQSSARVILALQNALCDGPATGTVPEAEEEDDDVVATLSNGSYYGSASGSYGNSFDVIVTVASNEITAIVIDSTSVTGTDGYGSDFDAGSADLIDSLVGMTVNEMLTLTLDGTGYDVTTGATDSTNTLIKAVQDALSGDTPYVADGTYSATNTVDPYDTISISVTVTVADNKVTAIVVTDDSGNYTNDSTGESCYTSYTAVKDALIAKLVGSDVATILGYANTKDSDLTYATGATYSCNNLLYAVQKALTSGTLVVG